LSEAQPAPRTVNEESKRRESRFMWTIRFYQ
jgi:hypothetical protein